MERKLTPLEWLKLKSDVDLTKVKGLCYTPLDCLLGYDGMAPKDFLDRYGEFEVDIDESNND